MAASSVEICNSALLKLGAETITALSDNTRRAKLCNEQYDRIRKLLLRAHPWNFAIKRAALVANVATPAFGYDVQFDLPADYLRALEEEDVTEDWAIEGNALFANRDDFNLKYIADISDTTLFDPAFDELLALALAKELAYPLVQSMSLKDAMTREYDMALRDIRAFDAQEGNNEVQETSEWLISRQ